MASSRAHADPRSEYASRLATRRAVADRYVRVDRALSAVRIALAVAFFVLWWLTLGPRGITPRWLLLPAALFVAVAVAHEWVARRRRTADRAVAFYERGLARLEERWAGAGDGGSRYLDETHPYAADLDLFGRASLFERLCTARTRGGQDALARWLCAPASREEALARQSAVAELAPRLDLREELALAGEDVQSGTDPEALVRWCTAPPVAFPRHARAITAAFAALNVLAAAAWALGAGGHALVLALALSGAWAGRLSANVQRTIGSGDRPGRDLMLLALVLSRLEREPFEAPLLAALRRRLDTEGLPPSRQLRRLARLHDLLESRRNQLFVPIALPLLWTTQIALAIEAWRRRVGPAVVHWLSAVSEIEALSSLAGYAYERPEDPFPEIVEDG
ncbi:MAG TPA: DNA mismatch repair protein MutS, partial [Vicinamibacteria bacterium]